MVAITNRNGIIIPIGDLVPGQYFKFRSWYWVAEPPRVAPKSAPYDWVVRAWDTTGHCRLQTLYGLKIEVMREDVIPPCFYPSAIRRSAKQMEERAEALLSGAGVVRQLANRLEKRNW